MYAQAVCNPKKGQKPILMDDSTIFGFLSRAGYIIITECHELHKLYADRFRNFVFWDWRVYSPEWFYDCMVPVCCRAPYGHAFRY